MLKSNTQDPAQASVDAAKISGVRPASTPSELNARKLRELLVRYERNRRAIAVDFRKMVPSIRMGERATHYLHPYPAKLIPQIAHFFAANDELSRTGETILDPFAGTATIGVEALIAGRHVVLGDSNPLARLISSVKCTSLSAEIIAGASSRLREKVEALVEADCPDVVNVDHWYQPAVKKALARLLTGIKSEPNPRVRDLLLATLSATARRCSRADPRLSVAVRVKEGRVGSAGGSRKQWTQRAVLAQYFAALVTNSSRLADLSAKSSGDHRLLHMFQDAREVDVLPAIGKGEYARLVVTSPPYAGAQKYIRASYLGLGWTELCAVSDLRSLEDRSIGREHHRKGTYRKLPPTGVAQADSILRRLFLRHELRAFIAAKYLIEMREAFKATVNAITPGGHIVLIAGNNSICGKPFHTAAYLQTILEQCGMRTRLVLVDRIKSRGLMTKRNRTAGVISREWIFVMHKPIKWS